MKGTSRKCLPPRALIHFPIALRLDMTISISLAGKADATTSSHKFQNDRGAGLESSLPGAFVRLLLKVSASNMRDGLFLAIEPILMGATRKVTLVLGVVAFCGLDD